MAKVVLQLSVSFFLIMLIQLQNIAVFGIDQILLDKQVNPYTNLQIRTNSSHDYGQDPMVKLFTKVKRKFRVIRKALNAPKESLVCPKLQKTYGSCDFKIVKKKILEEELEKLNPAREVMDISSALISKVEKLVDDFPKFKNEKKFIQDTQSLYRLLREGPPTAKPAVYSVKILVTKNFQFVSNKTRQRVLERLKKKSSRETLIVQNSKTGSEMDPKPFNYVALTLWIIGLLIFCTGCFFVCKCFLKSFKRLQRCCYSCLSVRNASAQNVSPIALRAVP